MPLAVIPITSASGVIPAQSSAGLVGHDQIREADVAFPGHRGRHGDRGGRQAGLLGSRRRLTRGRGARAGTHGPVRGPAEPAGPGHRDRAGRRRRLRGTRPPAGPCVGSARNCGRRAQLPQAVGPARAGRARHQLGHQRCVRRLRHRRASLWQLPAAPRRGARLPGGRARGAPAVRGHRVRRRNVSAGAGRLATKVCGRTARTSRAQQRVAQGPGHGHHRRSPGWAGGGIRDSQWRADCLGRQPPDGPVAQRRPDPTSCRANRAASRTWSSRVRMDTGDRCRASRAAAAGKPVVPTFYLS